MADERYSHLMNVLRMRDFSDDNIMIYEADKESGKIRFSYVDKESGEIALEGSIDGIKNEGRDSAVKRLDNYFLALGGKI